jgi:hypothetical protein
MQNMKSREDSHLESIRDEFFPESEDRRWPAQAGWFKAPRVLPVLLQVLRHKKVINKGDLGRVYLELLSRVRDQGVVDLVHPEDHARIIGYSSDRRGQRTWREAMQRLRDLGFIELRESHGRGELGYALIVNPFIPVKRLSERKMIEPPLWNLFVDKWSKAGAAKPYMDAVPENSAPPTSEPIISAQPKRSKNKVKRK